MYDTDIGNALRKACQSDQDNGTMHLAEAARLVRKDILNINMSFNGSFEQGCQEASVPKSLVTFIHMILEGSNIEHTTDNTSVAILSVINTTPFLNQYRRKADILHQW